MKEKIDWLAEEERNRLANLDGKENPTHKEMEEKSKLLFLNSLRRRKAENREPKDEKERELLEGIQNTFGITEQDLDKNV